MTVKQANKASLISFIIGVIFIFLAIVFANIFPEVKLTQSMRMISLTVLVFPWIIFIIFMTLSLGKK